MDLGPFGFYEILFIGLLALVVFGPRRLPEIGQAAGRAAAKLKRAAHELRTAYESELDEESREQIRSARSAIAGVKDTFESAGRDMWKQGDEASRAVSAAGSELRRLVDGQGAGPADPPSASQGGGHERPGS